MEAAESSNSDPVAPATQQESAPEAAPATGDDGKTVPSVSEGTQEAAPDPLAGSEPFKFSLGSESKTLEGFHRFPGEGVLVPEDKIPLLEQLAIRAETLDRTSRDLQSEKDLYERLSEWKTVDHEGKEQTLSGVQGLVQSQLDFAKSAAYQAVAEQFFSDPAKLASLLAWDEGSQSFKFNPETFGHAQTLLQLRQQEAQLAIRTHLSGRLQAPRVESPPDYTAVAPQVISGFAGANASVLTDADKQFLSAQMPRYVRAATAEDTRLNPALKVGQPVVDDAFRGVVTDRIGLRQEAKSQVTTASTTATLAQKFNQGQNKGITPKGTPKAPPAKPTAKAPNNQKPDWDAPFAKFMAEEGIPL